MLTKEAIVNVEAPASRRNNEISQFVEGRYISSSEGFWRIFGFHIHERYPSVTKLHVHLEGGQRVYFTLALRSSPLLWL